MPFSSVTFLFFFLPISLTLYVLAGRRGRNAVFLLASLVFYFWGEGQATVVLLLSISVNYGLGVAMGRLAPPPTNPNRVVSRNAPDETAEPRDVRTALLIAGLLFNLGLLSYFKYADFLMGNVSTVFTWFGMPPFTLPRVAVPTGISFFTFHAVSYLVDIHQGRADVEHNPAVFGIYIAAFPRILAGPIVPYHTGREELRSRRLTLDGFASGTERFVLGLGKKVLIANPLAGVADQVFDLPPESLTAGLAWLGVLCYTLQIYFDFSGYTDMAIGVGRMFGFNLPENFNFPYSAQSIQDFWRRWHMSLSRWLRDYLYIPLGGNRCSPARHYLNLVTVFVLCGLWHGANWTFVVWGLWYGVFLILERTAFGKALEAAPRPLRHLYALAVVILGWVFFRSESLAHSLVIFRSLGGLGTQASSPVPLGDLLDTEALLALTIGALLSMPLIEAIKKYSPELSGHGIASVARARSMAYGAYLGLVFLLACMALAGGTLKSFIYFRF